MTRISASILGFYFDAKKNKQKTEEMIKDINDALAKKDSEFDILHLDIEDGKFVKQKSFKPSEIRKIKCLKKKEAHFMVLNYKKYLKDFFPLADMFIFHNEIIKHDFPKTIEFLKKNHKFIGISINPNTPLSELKYLDKINLVLIMSVYPGLPGQKFIETSLRKIRKLKEIREKKGLRFAIEVDGGVNNDNKKKIIDAGADILVMGRGFFNA
ncbi:TPA: ribulose-phosphate 3-epimerase [Candidatus Woesearchaeota archaeon]|nr:ribulose-phosphate 3-epimerase [Candidatus Woesearchaeota archaeon]HIH55260.1 ribulose-phosphate 3-epimerase [Candidatus Woesearchaeota archaeon]HIJ02409.1 ribulose-phosphate 3-epimerase [Candidatus Woesearchaeota archaeon]HIJ13316.1 ribulose-phosphate 3-epimerase [Candidatus Woesearchaeota archaeon]